MIYFVSVSYYFDFSKKQRKNVILRITEKERKCIFNKYILYEVKKRKKKDWNWRNERPSNLRQCLKIWYEQAACPHDNENQWLLGLNQEKQFQQVKGGDLHLCSAVLRPHLDLLIHVQASQYRRDLGILEGVQTRAMKMIRGLNYLTYEEVLKRLGLFSLEKEGRRRGKKKICIKGSWTLYKEYDS